MIDSKPISSLSPQLLARKGGAKPAMRPQVQPLDEFHDDIARQMESDLGWNDMGAEPVAASAKADVVSIDGGEIEEADQPEIVLQQNEIAERVRKSAAKRRNALSEGRRAAFTLRIDADRHLKLRLASTIVNRSAQALLTDALDRLLDEMPEVQSLAANVRTRS